MWRRPPYAPGSPCRTRRGERGERNGATLAQTLKRLAPPSLRLRYDRRVDAAKAVMDAYPDWQSLLFGEGLAAVRRGGELHIRPAGLPPGAVELAAADRGHGVWRVEAGDTLRAVLERWGTRAGVEVLFLTDRRYRLHRGQAFEGAFIDAVRALFFALSHLPHPPAGEFTAGGKLARGDPSRAANTPKRRQTMNSGPITKLRQNITTIMAAVSVAVVAIPAARAAEPDLVSALRDQGAQIVPLGPRGGLAGYLVTPVGGAGYSLYVTNDGHGVAGLLYGPDGALLTGGQLAAVRGENRLAGAAPSSASGAPNPAANVEGAGVRDSGASTEAATPDTSTGVSRAALFERSASAFGFTLGERGPLVVLFGDPGCPWSRSAVARIGREAMAGKLRLHVVPVALLGAASAHRAAGIAASSNPAQAWFARTDGPSGVQARERIAGNNALFDAWGERSVPLIAYRAMQGGIAHRVGDIADLGAWLRELGDE